MGSNIGRFVQISFQLRFCNITGHLKFGPWQDLSYQSLWQSEHKKHSQEELSQITQLLGPSHVLTKIIFL